MAGIEFGRLTTDKPASEMGMFELAHNSCYMGEDGAARYRDFDIDIDAREFAKNLMRSYGMEMDVKNDDEFDDEMMELLACSVHDIEGLIALFYRNLWAMADLRETLKRYEDLAEEGKLLELPCKVGDTFWELNVVADPFIYPRKALSIQHCVYVLERLGTKAFLSEAEAEQALAEFKKIERERLLLGEWGD